MLVRGQADEYTANNKPNGGGVKMKEEKTVLNGIMKVAQETTDFDRGFDHFFRFMAKNPDSATTRGFIEYHRVEMNDPKTPKGDADFTYLIGKDFIDEYWIDEEDFEKFQEFCREP